MGRAKPNHLIGCTVQLIARDLGLPRVLADTESPAIHVL
jgi:hypothetical protein